MNLQQTVNYWMNNLDVNDLPDVTCNIIPKEALNIAFGTKSHDFLVFKCFGDVLFGCVASSEENGLIILDFFSVRKKWFSRYGL